MTSSRAYRDALPVAAAVDVLRRGAGKCYEADFVRDFIERVVPVENAQDHPSATTIVG